MGGCVIIGHRGASGYRCENTLSSFKHAVDLGLGWVETDCMLSGDGEVILFHDDDLARLGGVGVVPPDTDLAELQSYPLSFCYGGVAGGVAGGDLPLEYILSLRDFLVWNESIGLGINFEIKSGLGCPEECGIRLAETLNSYYSGDLARVIISSFSLASIRAFQGVIELDVDYALLYENWCEGCIEDAEEYGVGSVHLLADNCLEEHIRMASLHGLGARVYTVNDLVMAREFVSWGACGLFSDFGDRLRGIE